ncbi:MAG: outer membrane beta-barrel protein [Ginsengibacter sp.]
MKKKFSLPLLAVAILFSSISDAQTFSLGVRSGLSIPNLTAGSGSETNPLNTGYKSRLGPDEAIFGEYHLSSLFSLEAMIEFSSQGGKKTGLQAFPNPQGMPTYLYADFKSVAKFNYLLVPVLAKFGWKLSSHSPIRVYFGAGPFAGFLLSAHQITSGSSATFLDPQGTTPIAPSSSFDRNTDIKDQLNTLNFGVSGNVGFAYNFAKSNIFIEGGGNYGFRDIQKGTANGKNRVGAGTVALGYAYTFGK